MKLISFEKKENEGEAIVSIDRKDFEKELNITYNYQKKWFNIAGFRKGKVPRAVIENNYGHDVFYDGALQGLYVELINFIQKEKADDRIISLKSAFRRVPDPGVPSVIKTADDFIDVKVPLYFYPHSYIKLDNMSIEVEKEHQTSKEDIDNAKERLLKKHSSFGLISDELHKVEMGDKVKVSVSEIVFIDENGNDIVDDDNSDNSLESLTVDIGSGRAWKNFEDSLIGHSKGEGKISITLTFPEDRRLQTFSGKTVRFTLVIDEVRHLVPPPIDDLLKILKLKSEEELDSKIKSELDNTNHLRFEQSKRAAIQTILIDQISDDMLCKPLIDDKLNASIESFQRNLAASNLTIDYYCAATGTSFEDLRSEFLSSATKSFKLSSALLSASELLNMSCSDKDIDDYFDRFAKSNKVSAEIAKKNIPLPQVYSDILCDRAMEHLFKNVIVKDKVQVEKKKSTKKKSENTPSEPKLSDSEQK